MGRTCTVCAHVDRAAIDQALVSGEPIPRLAAKCRASEDSLARHKASHLPETLAKAQDARETARADDLLSQVKDLQRITLDLLAKATQAGDLRTAVSAVGQARGNLELLGKLVGQLEQNTTINLVVSPEWAAVRSTILVALAPFPDARVAVAERLLTLEGGGDHAGHRL